MKWIGLVARVVVGGVWTVAGFIKLSDPAATVRAVRAYQLVPESLVPAFGHFLPVVEITVGVCLLLGLLTRGMAVISAILLLMFLFGISYAWGRGLQIECGCFGGGGFKENAAHGYAVDILRDIGLIVVSVWLICFPRTRLSLDSLLFRPIERPDVVEQEPAVHD